MKKYTLDDLNGNAYCIIAYVRKAMKREGHSEEQIDKYVQEAMAGNYDTVIQTSMKIIAKLNSRQ